MPASSRSLPHAQSLQAGLRQGSATASPERESGPCLALPRAKAIARPERVVSARIFTVACEASRLSNGAIARMLGIDESGVRKMKKGEKPVWLEHVVRLQAAIEGGVGIGLLEHAKSRAIPTVGEPVPSE